MYEGMNVYRAIVSASSSATGEIHVKIPSILGETNTVPISFIGRTKEVSGYWTVPDINDQILVAVEDDRFSNVFLVNQATSAGGVAENGLPPGGATGDLLVKNSATNYDAAWTDSPTVDSLTFDQNSTDPVGIGRLVWNGQDGTLDLGLKGGNVTLQVGQETVHLVVNKTGADILEGQVVRLFGASGQRPGVALAQANNETNSSKTFGVATEQIDDNKTGFVTTEGLVRNINTNTLTEGAIIWLSPDTPGGMTTTKPTAPDHLVMVGVCVLQGNNGIIAVKVQNGYEVDELHDVKYTNLATGDILTRTSNNLWENITRANFGSTLNAASSTYAASATYATTAGTANAGSVTYATNAGSATYATTAGTANAGSVTYATNAGSATYATTAGTANAGSVTYATNAGSATYASRAASATSFNVSGNASVGGTFITTGAASAGSTLYVGGITTLGSSVSIAGNASVNGNITATGNTTTGTFNSTGAASAGTTFYVGGITTLNSTLTHGGVTHVPTSVSATAPSSPVVGQQWFDTTNNLLKVCKTAGASPSWQIISGQLPYFEIRRNTTWTVTNANPVAVTWIANNATNGYIDPNGFFNGNRTYAEIPADMGGIYLFSYMVHDGSASVTSQRAAWLDINVADTSAPSAASIGSGNSRGRYAAHNITPNIDTSISPAGTGATGLTGSAVIRVYAGDQIRVKTNTNASSETWGIGANPTLFNHFSGTMISHIPT